ncbi:Tetratricopeptide repeat-containing protein [Chryseobacterium oleae]|uniref:Tetratricopeptide repeat-containing protein n=1 Tax=Chryseobacterium oleae TaxID=491207 RepID=A0A1I4WKX9_CHROL|nr:tetratricopeptide repeat protein [Chryseobacterium oleae]SFN14388.1 Tetratricopeptide repeat-containing protein [Chryseobacterium oleae]
MKNKIIKVLIALVFSVIIVSCGSSEKEEANTYFHNINEEVSKLVNQPEKIKALQTKEQKKYESTGDRKYQISSRYIELFFNYDNAETKNDENAIKQIPVVYELLILNNNEYDYITIACDFNLAHQFEHQSPKLAMQFLNDAIKIDEKSGKKYYLPHLYHLKGRFLFNSKNYSQALIYFKKSLLSLDKIRHNLIFISSMHNNFALTYEKMGNIDLAIQEAKEAVRILETERNLKPEETAFLVSVKGNMGFYYYKKKDFYEAEKLLLQEFEFYKKDKKSNHQSITNLTELFDLYNETDQNNKMKEIADYSESIESETASISDKILINEMIQSYYLKMNDTEMVKTLCRKLITLHNKHEEESNKKLTYISDVLNNFTIKSINQKHQYTIETQKFKNKLMLTAICLVFIIFGVTIYIIRNINKREKELASKEKIILMKNKTILEQDLKRQEEKITNLHLNLNLKIETEKTFLENIKKMKKLKNVDAEQVITDLFLKINNLIQIDKKNHDLINESSLENKQFIQNLSERFPSLTNNELKFCVYYKLDFSSKEISLLENITEGSARVYKTKIKTKMNIGKESILNTYLKSI